MLPVNERRLKQLARAVSYSDASMGSLLPVLLDPSPAALLNGSQHPRFECAEARIARLLERGIGGIIKVSLSKRDCTRGVEWFLELLSEHVKVRALFLHPFQSLGPAGCGDRRTIEKVCRKRRIPIFESGMRRSRNRMQLYKLHSQMAFHGIADILGRPLAWKVRTDKVCVPLPQGLYRIRVGNSLQSLTSPHLPIDTLHISEDGNATITNPIAASFWLGILRRVGKG
jgi:hypothetical protein